MWASIVVLLLAVGADGPAGDLDRTPRVVQPSEVRPPAIREAVTGSAATAVEGRVVYGRPGPWPTQPNPLSACARRAANHVAEKFGFSYYYGLIPYHGPTHYNYRHQFDYPGHASVRARREKRLTIVGDSAQ